MRWHTWHGAGECAASTPASVELLQRVGAASQQCIRSATAATTTTTAVAPQQPLLPPPAPALAGPSPLPLISTDAPAALSGSYLPSLARTFATSAGCLLEFQQYSQRLSAADLQSLTGYLQAKWLMVRAPCNILWLEE